MGGAAGFNFGAPQQGQQPQQGPVGQKGSGGQYPGVQQFSNTPAQYSNPLYQKMIAGNGGAPTQDMISGLGAYGKPLYLMKQHQEQTVNNRKNDINGLYQEMLGRDGERQGIDYWAETGQNADQLRDDFANTPEYQNLVAQGLRKKYDPATYQKPEQQKAAADANAAEMQKLREELESVRASIPQQNYNYVG